ISFNYSSGITINGDLFISVETLKINAKKFKCKLEDELLRVMVHGILHLVGYEDVSKSEKEMIRSKEEKYLKMKERIS
ncbi:MAG: rRNA maturation RNase YbeY, partial [Bacteroidales bacterium]